MRSLTLYLALSGTATIVGGWLAIRAIDRSVGWSIGTKSVLTALTGTAVALLNVLLVAQMMFVSTSHDLRLLVALIVFSAIVTAFFSLWAASTTTSRLSNVAATVRVLASGGFAARAQVLGHDEVASLAMDTNALAAKLQTAEAEHAAVDAERRELTAAISHDLRTPLASLRAMVEALDDEVVVGRSEVKRYYVTMRREIDRLNGMIEDLFELAQIDAGALRLNVQPLSILEVVSEVVDAMQAQALQRGVVLSLEILTTPGDLRLDGARMERAIANVLRNALEHTPQGGKVTVSVGMDGDSALVRVADTGEGIAPDDLPNIWTRFFRAEPSRSRRSENSDGAGLGLAITRGIIESHGGTISAASQPGQGAVLSVRLPAPQARRDLDATSAAVKPAASVTAS
jgi:signal transduction histidine kinase